MSVRAIVEAICIIAGGVVGSGLITMAWITIRDAIRRWRDQ